MAKSLTIRKGDRVHVIAGKDKGKEGKVLRSMPEKERIVVENVHMIKKHARPSQKKPAGWHHRDGGHYPRFERDACVPEL